ncbi:hypothetical protein BH23VER1_BH23VER1_03080 [soil metagenome]
MKTFPAFSSGAAARRSRPLICLGAALFGAALFSPDRVSGQDIQVSDIVEPSSEWRYLDTGANLGPSSLVFGAPGYGSTNWKHPDFDDSAWKSGFGPLGFGDPGLGTTISMVSPGGARYITSYFRHEFEIEDLTEFSAIELGIRRDDGAIVYLNGRELFRTNMPAGTVQFNQVAAGVIGGAAETAYVGTGFATDSLVANGSLVTGRNVVAVELHNVNITSSDSHMDLFLRSLIQTPDFGVISPPIGTGFDFPFVEFGFQQHFRTPPTGNNPADPDLAWTLLPVGATTLTASLVFVNDAFDLSGEFEFFPDGDQQFYSTGVNFVFQSEIVDIRGFNDVQISVDLRTYEESNQLSLNDRVNLIARYTTDGIHPTATGNPTEILPNDVVFLDIRGGASSAGLAEVGLVSTTTPKRALVPTSAGALPANWNARVFDDSAWPFSGEAGGIGYEQGSGYEQFIGAGLDVGTAMYNVNRSAFIRAPFTLETLDDIQGLVLKLQFDDSFVAYLNGVEVRRDIPARAPGGTLAWNAGAIAGHDDANATVFQSFDLAAFQNLLVVGENVLAIHGLNFQVNSSDFLINPLLVKLVDDTSVPPSLNSLNKGPMGNFTTFTSPLGAIPDSAATVQFISMQQTNSENQEAIYMDNIWITGVPTHPNTFGAWMALTSNFTGAEAQALADPDADSIINLFEYAFGGNPDVSGMQTVEGAPIMPEISFDEQNHAIVKFQVVATEILNPYSNGARLRVQDLEYRIEVSDDLIFWDDGSGGAPIFQLMETGEGEGRTLDYTFRSFEPLTLIDDESLFVRVEVRAVIPLSP